MIIVFFFMSIILSCLPLIHSARPICPESFSCPSFSPFKYPFYNTSDTSSSCGLIKVNCTLEGGELQFEGRSYPILYKYDPNSSFFIRNKTFERLVNNKSCEALMNNFTSPSPLLFSFSFPFNSTINIFKCPKEPSYNQGNDAYFDQANYKSYNRCDNHSFYYKHPHINDTTVPSDLPQTCKVIQLPLAKDPWQTGQDLHPNETNIFSLLASKFPISFPLTPPCDECLKNGSHCQTTDNGLFQCLHAKKEEPAKGPTLIHILVIIGSVFIIMLSFIMFIIWRHNKNKPFSYFSSKDKSPILEDGSLFFRVPVYSYTELEDATKNFDPSHELGDGGFGAVYYGKLQDGREVAVKRLYEHNYKRVQQFINEVEILTRLRHPNLVVLYGCTSHQTRELLLVYEYIPNGTVADHLHGERANPTLLTWPIRMNIAIETASALAYLHASEIIHRDVKTNNILLDHNYSVKVADFGLSRLVPNNVTYVSTAPQGTPGYVDPQYHQLNQLTDKSDVYSFGVVLIELISSMVAVDLNRSQDEISLANLALNRIQKCAIEELIDPVLGADSNEETMRMIALVAELAFRCLQYDSEMRPTMNEVLDVLMDIQSDGRTDGCDSIRNLETVNPPSERSDVAVLLKDFLPSPVSVTSEWKSENSISTAMEIYSR